MRRWYYAVPLVAAGALALACSDATSPTRNASQTLHPSASVGGVAGAAYTTNNPQLDGNIDASTGIAQTQTCLNGKQSTEAINCNIYPDKKFVWINGGPTNATLTDGTYFFAVLDPGGQNAPNDGADDLLSTDTYVNRTFTVSGGKISAHTGNSPAETPHDFDGTHIRLLPYNNTSNPGGVYILALCKYDAANPVTGAGAPGVDPSTCKYDAFKVHAGGIFNPNFVLDVEKTAVPKFTRVYSWTIAKTCVPASLTTSYILAGGTTTAACSVTATPGAPTDSWGVEGDITITNNSATGSAAISVTSVTDALTLGGSSAGGTPVLSGTGCTVANDPSVSMNVPAEGGSVTCHYVIPFTSQPAAGQYINTATAAATQSATETQPATSQSFESNPVTFEFPSTPSVETDKCINVTDATIGTGSTQICYAGNSDPITVSIGTWNLTAPTTCGPWAPKNTAQFIPTGSTTPQTSDFTLPSYSVDGCGSLSVQKFYDVNANGQWDSGEPELTGGAGSGWPITLAGPSQAGNAFTLKTWTGLVSGTYTVTEGAKTGWTQSALYAGSYAPVSGSTGSLTKLTTSASTSIIFPIAGGSQTVVYGNYCTVGSNGYTIGFWGNNNGAAILQKNDPSWRGVVNGSATLWQASASKSGTMSLTTYSVPTGTFKTADGSFDAWLQAANASTNSTGLYMLSAQYAGALLNIAYGGTSGIKMDPSAWYAPANMTVAQVMSGAKALLDAGASSTTQANVSLYIGYLNGLNNGGKVIPATPCAH